MSFFTITCNIIPVIHKSKAITKNIQETIRLGNLGTKPVLKYSTTTGIPKTSENAAKINEIILKKNAGLYSLKSVAIVFKTLNPSLYVFNLETLPSGLSLYPTGISFNKKF